MEPVSLPFIKLLRNPLTEQLIRQPNCLAVLTLVAYRARRSDEISLNGLSEGEAMMGDFDACGLTRQEFRTALNKLLAWGFVTTRPTNKGTIVKLISSAVYDINLASGNQPATSQQPSDNQPVTTNKKVKKEKKETLSDSADASPDDGLSFEAFWQAYGRKEGSKSKMAKQWNVLPLLARQHILNGLEVYRNTKTANGPQYMPLPQTFLNGKLWEAETYGQQPETRILHLTPNETPTNTPTPAPAMVARIAEPELNTAFVSQLEANRHAASIARLTGQPMSLAKIN